MVQREGKKYLQMLQNRTKKLQMRKALDHLKNTNGQALVPDELLCLTVDIIQKLPEAGRQSTYQAVGGKALLGHVIFPPWS